MEMEVEREGFVSFVIKDKNRIIGQVVFCVFLIMTKVIAQPHSTYCAFSTIILLSSVYTLTKSPFPIPKATAKDFGRTMENDDSPTSPGSFLYSLLFLLAVSVEDIGSKN
jgi:hypothetical protein